MNSYCKDRVAVVTGAGGTLCSCIAIDLAKQGAMVVLIGRTASKLEKTAAAIAADGGTVERTGARGSFAADGADDAQPRGARAARGAGGIVRRGRRSRQGATWAGLVWCDHREGIFDVFEKAAAYGILSTFVGMTTDSRSFLSFVRHDYFRRLLARWMAQKVADGDFPDDETVLRPTCENIAYRNAHQITGERQ